ncbi:ABC transporter ATP-binding protein [Aquabacterium sp. J223]|uniref:ABC transporter ATP-binding protein n=1 Tax=Aquabacterium sp. J223 TaxID=2898431 RepID=UPI0021AD549A|nr:ABC transporter ATP-binding protein [Aquabacterium sp. J223]UUX94049.1 ABC transporter ATP-binding protein [Aquabacterium sp. J223]
MPLLEVDALEVFYRDLRAVAGVSVHVDEGELVAIIGANGAGKSTLLRALAGLHPARAGRVVLAGTDITRRRADLIARSGVALVPEGRRLFASLSVEENLLMGGMVGRAGPWSLEAVYQLFPAMREFRARSPAQISGGQQQMVAIGRALMSNPRLLLCDELSLGLAPKVIDAIYACFSHIRASGISILLVEQDVVRARAAADRVYCLLEGRVSLEGPAAALTVEQIAQAYFGATHAVG